MSKEDKPLEYQRRIRDTKGVAQRLDLNYLKRPAPLVALRKYATWGALIAAIIIGVPRVLGIGNMRKTLESGPLSEAHALFENRCEVCHTQAFSGVPDKACVQCHDGAAHPAKLVDTGHPTGQVRCAECHMEHRGKVRLAAAGNANCTSCHADITAHSTGAKVRNVSAFRPDRHPEFSTAAMRDLRPLRLNHAIHMPADSKMVRGIKLPMKCGDCHVVDRNSPTGQLLPVTFEQNCKTCHARELEFDVDHVVSNQPVPAPHAKDAKVIHEFIWNAFAGALKANPALARHPVGNDLTPQPNAQAWMVRVVKDSETYLFGRKCGYCHQTLGNGEVRKVNVIAGRYAEDAPQGVPWLQRGEFAHRSHRAVECESCHAQARASTKTEDVLIPAMKTCTPCHGDTGASLDDCAKCHQYHNRSLEKDRVPGKLVGQTIDFRRLSGERSSQVGRAAP
jgi:hypothetical protein